MTRRSGGVDKPENHQGARDTYEQGQDMDLESGGMLGLGAAIGTAAGVIVKHLVDGYLKVRQQQTDEEQHEESRVDENYQFLIGKLEGRIDKMEADAARDRKEHLECVRIQGELAGRIAELEKAMNRHDRANREHVEKLAAEVEKRLTEGTP